MKVSIATFNAENLITAGKPIYDEPRPRYTAEQYPRKVGWMREQLLKMNADIVGFQEVFEEQALRDCLEGTHMAQWHLRTANPTGLGPVNAILSKFPIVDTRVVEDIPVAFEFYDDRPTREALDSQAVPIPIQKFSRGVLIAKLQIREGLAMQVVVLHLKSKRPIFRGAADGDNAGYAELAQGNVRSLIRRAVEACGVRKLISEELDKDDGTPLCVLGDMNDNDTSVTSQAIIGEEPFRNLPPAEKEKRWRHVLQNCRDVQARKSIENFQYSYIHNGHYESLDNIFVSNHFADLNKARLGRVIDVRLFNDHVIDSKTSLDRKPFFASDHGQVMANLEISDPPPA
ncbi:endonuclease/exonuclease/phosphatase family protein [Pseudoduganella namucuonensis]|uniref:Endonuclease/Exonuclease/phosphatase family protein n=1 Tax=Pseudoduganella namucuonensis TaxID=1035707 RepID=A0A1I7KMW0_9BURK|nr:endonuclease/exonuclease/phosphatase family protein [Pseudoduganella namucuonensis]SFU98741.1 Endonuclease/Exonuclease/phosphatase family protein [Pseudoduganella namucuonensis]